MDNRPRTNWVPKRPADIFEDRGTNVEGSIFYVLLYRTSVLRGLLMQYKPGQHKSVL